MAISKVKFKKLLPTGMRSTRWGDLIDAYQNTYEEFKQEKVDSIITKYGINTATEDELKGIAYFLGFTLSVLDGYTSSLYYLRREISTIVKRIKNKTTRICYNYISMIFNIIGSIGNTSNTIINLKNYLYYEATTSFLPVRTIDQDELYLDTPEFPTLDLTTFSITVTRSLLYNFKYKFIENVNEFMSINTLKALTNDVKQAKRPTEEFYFQPILEIEANRDDYTTTRDWIDYGDTFSRAQSTYLFSSGVVASGIASAHFGNSSHILLTSGITDVRNKIFAVSGILNTTLDDELVCDTQVVAVDTNSLDFQLLLNYSHRMSEASGITEAAFFNASSGIVLYSTFPKIQWDPDAYGNLRVQITLV